MSYDKRIQAKHVPEAPILRALANSEGWMTHWYGTSEAMSDPAWSLPAAEPELRAFPERVLLAKLAAMKRRDLIDGCECGCRGDWVILDKGRETLNAS